MGDKFELVTAFSRETSKKVYVQHKLKERAKEVNELLLKKAYFYVCGDAANMAREVNTLLAQILAEERGISEAKAEEIVKNMRAANQYQVRHDRPVAPNACSLGAPHPIQSVERMSGFCSKHCTKAPYRRMCGLEHGWLW